MVDLKMLLEGLKTSSLDLTVKVFEEIDSTNAEAKRLILSGFNQDLLIVSSLQTAGRGRQSRSWFSPIGGLYFSIVLRPRLGTQFASLASFLSGCAVAISLQSYGINRVNLKWPNDVLIGEDKIAGILNELVSVDSDETWMIIGVGINQNISLDEFPGDLSGRTISMLEVLGKATSPEQLLCLIINEFDSLLQLVETERSFSSILKIWRKLSSTLGRRVRVNDGLQVYTGIAEDLLEDGSLVLLTESGREKIMIGDVTHLRID